MTVCMCETPPQILIIVVVSLCVCAGRCKCIHNRNYDLVHGFCVCAWACVCEHVYEKVHRFLCSHGCMHVRLHVYMHVHASKHRKTILSLSTTTNSLGNKQPSCQVSRLTVSLA